MNIINRVVLPIVVLGVFLFATATFEVKQYQSALEFRLGEIVQDKFDPGLHFKAPFIDTVVYIDRRILDLEAPAQEVIASDQKRLVGGQGLVR